MLSHNYRKCETQPTLSVSTASQQIDVFSRVLKTSVASILTFRGASLENLVADLTKLVSTPNIADLTKLVSTDPQYCC